MYTTSERLPTHEAADAKHSFDAELACIMKEISPHHLVWRSCMYMAGAVLPYVARHYKMPKRTTLTFTRQVVKGDLCM